MLALPLLLLLAANLVDDQVTDLVGRVRFLAGKEAAGPKSATLRHLDEVLGGKPFVLPVKSISRESAQALLTQAEETEDVAGYDLLAGYVRKSGASTGTDNPSVRARLALADLAELMRTDYQTVLPELASFRKNPVVVIFWATWCAPCQAEMPLVEKLYQDGVQVLAVSEEPTEVVQQYMSQFGFTFQVATGDRRGAFQHFGVPGMPATRVLDGRRRLRITGGGLAEVLPLLERLRD